MKKLTLPSLGIASLVLAASLAGCSNPSTPHKVDEIPSYGDVIGSGTRVVTGTGEYERIKIPDGSDLYSLDASKLEGSKWTQEDGNAAQKFLVDYLATEYVDSSVLEGGDGEYDHWYYGTAPKYFSDQVFTDLKPVPNSNQLHAVLGDFNGKTYIPNLIHDGKPRQKKVDINVVSARAADLAKDKYDGIEFNVTVDTDFRVDDKNAAALAGLHSPTLMSGDEFLKTSKAKDQLKDGTGENLLHNSVTLKFALSKTASGEWEIVGMNVDKSSYNTDDFTNK